MDISAENTFTASKLVRGAKNFDLLVAGTFVATVTLQVSHDDATWHDVDVVTEPSIQKGELAKTWYIRAGVKTGDYTSGTATVEVV